MDENVKALMDVFRGLETAVGAEKAQEALRSLVKVEAKATPEPTEVERKQAKEIDDLRRSVVELTERAELEAIKREVTEKFPHLPGTADQKATAVRLLRKSYSKDAAEVEKWLVSLDQLARNATAEMGSEDADSEDGAMARFNKEADELVKAGKAKTFAHAVTIIARSNPALYNEYTNEIGSED